MFCQPRRTSFDLYFYSIIEEQVGNETDQLYANESQKEDLELPLFSLSEVVKATHNFSLSDKIGEGGYGPVYKGVLQDGKEIAVKRLSKTSNQGLDELKNEVICISKLQHRNLVRLLGCCIQGDEKMLIYEYMPNQSLDYFIFGHFCHFMPKMKLFVSGSLMFYFCCHFHPNCEMG
ncbi:putative protein kinase RLK-Pelle-DLSV family [Helianthus anomalus]